MVDERQLTEHIPEKPTIDESVAQAEKILGTKIKKDSVFTFREIHFSPDGTTGTDRTVKIQNITREKNKFFDSPDSRKKDQEQTVIEMDQEVIVQHYPEQKKSKKLTLGQFVKWYRQMDAVPEQKMTIEELNKQLEALNNEKNQERGRDSNAYPPITVQPGEFLCYDSQPPTIFKIDKIEDGKITLDNGDEYTPQSFLNWVKDRDAEKFSPEAEAERRTKHMEENTDEEKEEKEDTNEKIKSQAKKTLDEREEQKEELGKMVMPSSETTSPPSVGYLTKLYHDTYFLSMASFWELGKQIIEYLKRYWDRAEKERIGAAGSAVLGSILPQVARELETVRQQSENENVNFYKQSYEQYGYADFLKRLAVTGSRDELKAIITCMAEKGWIRWEDKTLWSAIQRIGIKNGVPSKDLEKHNEDSIQNIIDNYFWGEGSFSDFRSTNDSKYDGDKNSWKDWVKRLENDPEQRGGMRGRLQGMLMSHMNGDWVNPAQYEAILHYAIEAGKLSFGDKIYFLVMGLAFGGKPGTVNEGKPILTWGRLSDLEGTLLNNFPLLDYFVDQNFARTDEYGNPLGDPQTGKQQRGLPAMADLQFIINEYIKKDAGTNNLYSISNPADLKPGKNLQLFIEDVMPQNNWVKQRLGEKSARDMSNWDHDDFHIFAPQMGERQAEQMCTRGQASPAALKNGMAGWNHFIKKHLDYYIQNAASGNKSEADENLYLMTEKMKTFIRTEAILDNKLFKDRPEYQRFSDSQKNTYALADSSNLRTVTESNQEVHRFVDLFLDLMRREVAKNPELLYRSYERMSHVWNLMERKFSSNERQKLNNQKDAFDNFGSELENALHVMEEHMGQKGFAKALYQIQNGTVPGSILIKGIGKMAESKEEMNARRKSEEQTTKVHKLKEANFTDLAAEYRRLKRQAEIEEKKPAALKKTEKKEKIEQILQYIDQEQYGRVGQRDEKMLQSEIDSMRRTLGEDEALPRMSGAEIDEMDNLDMAA